MAKKKYYFAKLNVNGNIFSQDVDEIISKLIPEAIQNDEIEITYRQNRYSFTDTKEVNFEDRIFIHGNLTKAKKIKALVKDGNITKEKEFDEFGANTAEFFYDVNNEIIVYRTTSEIKDEHFQKFFKELIERDYRIGELKIFPYTKENSIRDKINSIDVVTDLKFFLIKPNPGKKEFFEFENVIKENNLKELDIIMSNKEGIRLKKNEKEFTNTIESGIILVESAYGRAEVKGYNRSLVKTTGKKDKPIKRKVTAVSAKFNRFLTVQETDVRDILKKIGNEISKILKWGDYKYE